VRWAQRFGINLTIICTFLNNGYAFSEDYRIGYVACIISDLIPEEKLDFYIKNEKLYINLLGSELDPSTQEKLLQRIKKTNFFKAIRIATVETPTPTPSTTSKQAISVNSHTSKPSREILPAGAIYDSPIADPKWPKFTAGIQKHFKNTYGKNVFNLSFGENLSLVRYKTDRWAYEFGLQAGVFGLMDVASAPTRLINSDYFVGGGLSLVYDRKWKNLLQFSHLSSHLGDEFLISRPDYVNKRVNLSYEAFKWFTAYKFNSLRPYIGFGYLVHRDPATLKPFTLEGGIDYISPAAFLFDTTRFVCGVHMHFWSANNFKPSLNIRTGLQLEDPVWRGRYMQFLIEYSQGKSRHGQFYAKKEHCIGLMIAISN
jgi:hypothetical protein